MTVLKAGTWLHDLTTLFESCADFIFSSFIYRLISCIVFRRTPRMVR